MTLEQRELLTTAKTDYVVDIIDSITQHSIDVDVGEILGILDAFVLASQCLSSLGKHDDCVGLLSPIFNTLSEYGTDNYESLSATFSSFSVSQYSVNILSGIFTCAKSLRLEIIAFA